MLLLSASYTFLTRATVDHLSLLSLSEATNQPCPPCVGQRLELIPNATEEVRYDGAGWDGEFLLGLVCWFGLIWFGSKSACLIFNRVRFEAQRAHSAPLETLERKKILSFTKMWHSNVSSERRSARTRANSEPPVQLVNFGEPINIFAVVATVNWYRSPANAPTVGNRTAVLEKLDLKIEVRRTSFLTKFKLLYCKRFCFVAAWTLF